MREIERIGKHLIKAFGWLCFVVLLAVLEMFVILSHYFALTVALSLAGTDGAPLVSDTLLGPLLGPLLGTIVGEANLANTIALGMAASLAAGAFFVAHGLEGVLFLTQHYDEYRADPAEKRLAVWQIAQKSFWLLLISVGLFYVGSWDVTLFRFRSSAGALGIESAVDASKMASFSALAKARPEQSFIHLARVGAVGMIFVTVLVASCLAACVGRIEEHLTSMAEAVARWFEGPDAREMSAEPAPAAADEPRITGGEKARSGRKGLVVGGPREAIDPLGPMVDGPFGPGGVTPMPGTDQPAGSSDAPGLGTTAAASVSREVVGEPGTRLTYEEARRQPARYRISTEDGSIWSQTLWKALHQEEDTPENGVVKESKAA